MLVFKKSFGSSLMITWEQFSSCFFKAEENFGPILLTLVTYFVNFIFSFLRAVWIWISRFLDCFWLFSKKEHTMYYIVFIITFKTKGNNRSLLSDMSHLKIEEASFNIKFLSKHLTCQRMSKKTVYYEYRAKAINIFQNF